MKKKVSKADTGSDILTFIVQDSQNNIQPASDSNQSPLSHTQRCVTLPLNSLQRGMTLPFGCSLSLMTLPSEARALPQEKTYHPYVTDCFKE